MREIRAILDAAEQADRGLTATEIAACIRNAGNYRDAVVGVINSAQYADSTERRDALKVLFAEQEQRHQEDSLYDAAAALREQEVRSLMARTPGLHGPRPVEQRGEWSALLPSAREFRDLSEGVPSAGGYTVPEGVAAQYVDRLTARSVFLRGLPASNVIRYGTQKFVLPQLVSSDDAGYVAEGTPIPSANSVFNGLEFDSLKIAQIRNASNELLQDTALNLRQLLAEDMVRSAGLTVDKDAFTGSGTSTLKGVIPQGTTIAGAVTWDAISGAVEAIEATGGAATVVWAAPDVANVLRTTKATGSGEYVAGAPTEDATRTAWGLPILVSTHIPAGHAVVADGNRVYFGVRTDVALAVSEHARFDYDQVSYRVTYRVGGICVAEATSVQVITGA